MGIITVAMKCSWMGEMKWDMVNTATGLTGGRMSGYQELQLKCYCLASQSAQKLGIENFSKIYGCILSHLVTFHVTLKHCL